MMPLLFELQDFGGRQLIHTPAIFYKWFPSTMGGVHGFGQRPVGRAAPTAGNDGGQRHHWGGGGHRLGGN